MRKWGTKLSAVALTVVMTAAMPLSPLASVSAAGEPDIESEVSLSAGDWTTEISEAESSETEKSSEESTEEPTEAEEPSEESAEESTEAEEPSEESTEESTEAEEPSEESMEESTETEEPSEESAEESTETEEPSEESTEESIEAEEPIVETPTEGNSIAVPDQLLPETSASNEKKVELIFTQDSVELEVAETQAVLELLEIPNGYEEIDIDWSSSNDSIAVVDEEGIITAVSAGSCMITAYLEAEDAEGTLNVTVREATPQYDQIDNLTGELENVVSSEASFSEEELEQAEVLGEDINSLQSEYKDLLDLTKQAEENGVMPFAVNNYHNAILLDPEFNGTSYERGSTIKFPFTLFCYGVYSGEKYYVEIYNAAGYRVSGTSGVIPYANDVISLTLSWSSENPAGKYYIRYWASGRKQETYDWFTPFYIVDSGYVATPTINKIVNTVQGIHVYWNKVSGANNYSVLRATSKNGPYSEITTTSASNYTDTRVSSGKTYYYAIKANKGLNESAPSSPKGITFVDTPDLTLRVNRSTGVGLGWNKIPGATGYAIYRKTTGSWVRVATIAGNNTFTWTDTAVKPNNGTVYHYTIRALAGSNRNTLSGCRSTGRTMVRLFTPTISSAVKASSTSLKATWNRNSSATGYEVRLMVGSSVYKTYTYGNNKTVVKTITGLPSGKTYKVQVRSYKKVSGVGSFYSAWSAAKYVTVK